MFKDRDASVDWNHVWIVLETRNRFICVLLPFHQKVVLWHISSVCDGWLRYWPVLRNQDLRSFEVHNKWSAATCVEDSTGLRPRLFIVRRNTTFPDWSFRATGALVSPTGDHFAKQVRQELPKSTNHRSLKLIVSEEPVCLNASSVSTVFGLAASFSFFIHIDQQCAGEWLSLRYEERRSTKIQEKTRI